MESRRERAEPSLVAASAAAISLVLGDGDLLGEIFLRLAFPTDLVRAAAVCRRWLRAASGPAFLRRFRDLHPPRHLGLYINTFGTCRRFRVDFVPMLPQPPEVAAVVRRGLFDLEAYVSGSTRTMECRNGRVVVILYRGGGDFLRGVHSPLHPARGFVAFPPLPVVHTDRKERESIFSEILSKENGDGPSYFLFSLDYCGEQQEAIAHVHKLQDNAWSMEVSATAQFRLQGSLLKTLSVFLDDDKIYMGITVHNILVLDLAASTFSTIKYPDRVAFDGEIMLSRANGSGVYLVHVNELQLCIWFHRGNGGVGDWLLVDTISLRDLCADLKISNNTTEDGHDPDVYIHQVGENAESVFLQMYQCVLYLDVKSRTLRKVYDVAGMDTNVSSIHPFIMTWPPVFPVLQE